MVIMRDLIAGLARRQPSVNLGPLDVLACVAFSGHVTQLHSTQSMLMQKLRHWTVAPLCPVSREASRNLNGMFHAVSARAEKGRIGNSMVNDRLIPIPVAAPLNS